MNSICLALIDYNPENENSKWNQSINYIGFAFTILFTIEAMIKIIALGFILHQFAYLRSFWNILDFMIVVTG